MHIACCQGGVVRLELACSQLGKILCEAIGDDIVMEYVMEYFLDYVTYSIPKVLAKNSLPLTEIL